MKTYQFGEYRCELLWGRYQHGGRVALRLMNAETGEPVATATVNIDDLPLEEGEVFVKDYCENEGMLEFLVQNGIVADTGKRVENGYVTIPVAKLLVEPSFPTACTTR